MSMRERMHSGELYLSNDPEIMSEQRKRLDMLYDYNMTRPAEAANREAMLKEMLAEVGEGAVSSRRFTRISAERTFISGSRCTRILT